MNSKPTVSVCLVTYNRAKLLPRTLDSILKQDFSDFELIIRDDNSVDGTEEICREYARHDSRINYICNKNNLGMPGNLNASLQDAKGYYVANLHDGDVYRNDLILKWKKALDAYPTAAFVFNSYRTVEPDGNIRIHREAYPPLIKGHDLLRRLLSRWDSCVFGTVMARRSVYEKTGWFDPQFSSFSDVDMWMRISAGHDVAYVDEPLIDLMPKDMTRAYGFVDWKSTFYILGMHLLNMQRCQTVIPEMVRKLQRYYGWRRFNYLMKEMLICLKHRRWDLVSEGFAIWQDSDDTLLRFAGKVFGRQRDLPEWYSPFYWGVAQFKK